MASKRFIIEVASEYAADGIGHALDLDHIRILETRTLPANGKFYMMITANALMADTILREWLRQRKIQILEEA